MVETLGNILFWLGITTYVVGNIWLLVVAFRQSVLWGVALFIPFMGLVFIIMHWSEGWKPLALNLTGLFLVMIGATLTNTGT